MTTISSLIAFASQHGLLGLAALAMPVAGAGTRDRAALDAIATAFTDSWNRHDMKAFADLFAPDADFVNVVGMWWKTRDEIGAAHAHGHATFFRDSRLVGETQSVKFLGPDVATVHVVWELSGQREPDGSTGQPRRGILLFVLRRQGGRWLIHTAQNTDTLEGALTRPAEKP